MDNQPKNKIFRSGFVSIIGRPNVGKSTLLNRILGERIAITTYKPQTTRHRILGVHHFEDGQIVYLDTPGIHRAKGGLNKYMVDTAMATIADADIVYFMVEGGPKFIDRPDLGEGNQQIIEAIERQKKNLFFIINKVDQIERLRLLPFMDKIRKQFNVNDIFPISALKGEGVNELVKATIAKMPEGPAFYPDDIVTDRTMRFLASEIVREKTMLLLKDEVPYSTGVVIEQFLELDGGARFHIDAVIVVERASQKGIVIGKGGQTIKKIGEAARIDLEASYERPVGLKLFVKVRKEWTSDSKALDDMGYN